MRVQFKPSQASAEAYRSALNSDLGVYHLQTGAGIGSFFGNLLKKIVPIGKKLFHFGYEALKPELEKTAKSVVRYGTNAVSDKLQGVQENLNQRTVKRRKQDALS